MRGHSPAAMIAFALVAAMMLMAWGCSHVKARDLDGRWANSSPEIKQWFDSLASKRGSCCSDADGTALSDVDWESSAGRFRVRLNGNWYDVPDDALVTVPNRVGRTMVWPVREIGGGFSIRCFMPGAMT